MTGWPVLAAARLDLQRPGYRTSARSYDGSEAWRLKTETMPRPSQAPPQLLPGRTPAPQTIAGAVSEAQQSYNLNRSQPKPVVSVNRMSGPIQLIRA